MDNLKKVLHLRSSGGMLGAENVIIELCKKSHNWGYEPLIGAFSDNDDIPEFLNFAPQGIKTTVFKCNGRFDISLIQKIRKFIRRNDIKLIHCHGYKEDFYGLFSGKDIVKLATNHLWKKTNLKGKLYAFLDTLFLRHFDGIIGVSDEIVKDMHSKGIKKNTIIINNGIDVSKFRNIPKNDYLAKKYGIDNQKFVIGMVSSLTPEKGHIIAIEAIAPIIKENENIILMIVGGGPSEDDIILTIRKYGLQNNVILAGRQSNIPEYLSIFDAFMMPSFKEGLPMALLEAMASRKIVVASSVGEIPNVINDKINGFLFPPGDCRRLSEVLHQVIFNSEQIEPCRNEALRTVEQNYSSDVMVKEYCQFYETLSLKYVGAS